MPIWLQNKDRNNEFAIMKKNREVIENVKKKQTKKEFRE